jgi:hypothetical protein
MHSFYKFIRSHWSPAVASVLVVSMFMLMTGIGAWVKGARAEALTNVKDILSDSDLSVSSAHSIYFTTYNVLTAGQTINIEFDAPTNHLFKIDAGMTAADIAASYGATVVAACGGGSDEMTFTRNSAYDFTLTVCAGDSVPPGEITIITATSSIVNPNAAGSYVIRITTTNETNDFGDTRVAIIDDVTMTAAVDTTLMFEIDGLLADSSTTVNGTALTKSTTATTIPFGTLIVGQAEVAGQGLKVTTNARNGFSVTVQQDHNLLSQTGADIDLFQDGASTLQPIAWVAPSNILDQENTYGHYGVTSDDRDLNGNEFNVAQDRATSGDRWSGAINTPREVFSHIGPTDGKTFDEGYTKVAYKIQIASLQEAATDYINSLTYVCTPTF